jgi:hypothetical protein
VQAQRHFLLQRASKTEFAGGAAATPAQAFVRRPIRELRNGRPIATMEYTGTTAPKQRVPGDAQS